MSCANAPGASPARRLDSRCSTSRTAARLAGRMRKSHASSRRCRSSSKLSAEWEAASEEIARDMHAHLKRREKKEEADLIGRSPIGKVFDFFGSKYFRNVRKSLGIFMGAWVWYVLNTKTYIQPEYED